MQEVIFENHAIKVTQYENGNHHIFCKYEVSPWALHEYHKEVGNRNMEEIEPNRVLKTKEGHNISLSDEASMKSAREYKF